MTVSVTRHTVSMVNVDLVQVNFASFFPWMDEGYATLLRRLGHPLSGIIAAGFATPVVDARCEYRRPLALDDEFEIRSAVSVVGRSSYMVSHLFFDTLGTFAIGRSKHVWVATHPEQRPEEVPSWLRSALENTFLENVGGHRD